MSSWLSSRTPRFLTQLTGLTWTPHTRMDDFSGGIFCSRCFEPNQINSVLSGLSCSFLARHQSWMAAVQSSNSCQQESKCCGKVLASNCMSSAAFRWCRTWKSEMTDHLNVFGVTNEIDWTCHWPLWNSILQRNRLRHLQSNTVDLISLRQVGLKSWSSSFGNREPRFQGLQHMGNESVSYLICTTCSSFHLVVPEPIM